MIRKKIKKTKFYLVLITSIVLLASLYLEYQPTPQFITEFIRREFSKKGYDIEFKSCYTRLWGKSEIKYFKINSKSVDIIGDSLKINLRPLGFILLKPLIKDFYGDKISLTIKSNYSKSNVLFIHNTNFKGRIDFNNITIDSLTFSLLNTAFTIKGIIPLKNFMQQDNGEANFPKKWVYIIEKIKSIRNKLRFNKMIQYDIDFDLTEKQQIKNKIVIPSFSHNGIKCKNIKLNFSYLPQTQTIDINKFAILFNDQEKVHGSIILNIKEDSISQKLFINATPQTILNLTSPKLAKEIIPYLPKFNSKFPPSILINVENAPLKEPSKWNYYGTISVEKCYINDLKILNGNCKFTLDIKKKNIDLKNVNLICENFKGQFNLLLDFFNKTIFLNANGEGDPRLFSNFVWDNPTVKKRLVSIWKDFKWDNKKLPKFSLNFINTLKNSKWDSEPNIITDYGKILTDSKGYNFKTFVEGKLEINNCLYRNQAIKHASADFHLKFPQFMMLRNIKIDTGNGMINNGIYIIKKEATLLNFNSSTAITFLNKISPISIELPNAIEYTSNPIIEFDGIFYNDYNFEQVDKINAIATFPTLKILKNITTNNHHEITLIGNEVEINSIGKVHGGKYLTSYKHDIENSLGRIKVKVENMNFTKFIGSYEEDSPFVKGAGEISGEANLLLDYAVPDEEPINISGKSKCIITKGAFAKIPLFSFLDIKSLTKITEVYAPKLFFKRQKIYTPKEFPITTNGVILSLSSYGYFNWHTLNINFGIKTRFLKDLIFIPLGNLFPIKATGLIYDPKIELDW